jgi:nitrous oxidase accessory protein
VSVLIAGLLSHVVAGDALSQTIRVRPGDALQAKVEAAPAGATVVLTTGTHQGAMTIDKRLTIRGGSDVTLKGQAETSVITAASDHVAVKNLTITGSGRDLGDDEAGVLVTGDHVTLDNLTLRNNLHGIYVRGGKNVTIRETQIVGLAAIEEKPAVTGQTATQGGDGIHHNPPGAQALIGNGIHLWNAKGAAIVNNTIHDVRDGIYVAHSDQSRFVGNKIHDGRYGIHYMYSHNNRIEGNELWRNVAGAALMFSRNLTVQDNILRDHSGLRAYGLLLQDVDYSTFTGNTMRGNRSGLRLQNSNANTLRHNRIAGNITGITMGSASRENTLARNRIGPNLRQLELTGPVPPTHWSVDGKGNRWHNAMPLDLNADGVSEWPHHEVDLVAAKRQQFAPIQLLTGSAGIRAVEWALSRAPVPGMRYITDPNPLTAGGADD